MNLPRWTCSRCGTRVRHATDDGKPVPPRSWTGIPGSSPLLCPKCRAKGPPPRPRSDYDEYVDRCGPVVVTGALEPKPKAGRALTPERRAEIAARLREDPATRNYQLAEEFGHTGQTIAAIRRKLEEAGAIPFVPRRGAKRRAA